MIEKKLTENEKRDFIRKWQTRNSYHNEKFNAHSKRLLYLFLGFSCFVAFLILKLIGK